MSFTREEKPFWEKLILFLFPTIELEGTLWQNLWYEERRQAFRTKMRVFFLIGAVGFAAHFFLIDLPAKVQPLHLWAAYRFGFAATFLLAGLLTYTRFIETTRLYWLPYYVIAIAASYFQAQSMLWDARVPFFFAIAIPVLVISVYGFAIVPSLAMIGLMFGLEWFPLSQAMAADPEGLRTITSAYLAGIVWTIGVRSSYTKDVHSFIKRQELIQERQKVIEGQKELTNQLKGFVPSEIFNRILIFNRRNRMTMTQATDEVIRPRKKTVACVYSDIRSFTRDSRQLDTYLLERAIPNIRLMTEIAESRHGISRLVGDLILSYFDQENPHYSLLLALDCGMEIAEKNTHFQSRNLDVGGIQRNVIISFGDCIVGNIGATDHAREITPLGPPVNLSSRLDSFLKGNSHLSEINTVDELVLTKEASDTLEVLVPGLKRNRLNLRKALLTVKDFPEVEEIISLPYNHEVKARIRAALERYLNQTAQHSEGILKEYRYDYAI